MIKNIVISLVVFFVFGVVDADAQTMLRRKYGVENTISFCLYDATGVNLKTNAAHVAGDTVVGKDGGSAANTTNEFAAIGGGCYSLVLSAAEMQAARVLVTVIDQGTKEWLDKGLLVETYGHTSAQHIEDVNIFQVAGSAVSSTNDFKLTVAEILNTNVQDYQEGTLGGYIDSIKKYVANRLVVSSGNYTVYKDNGSTVFETGTTGPSGRNPN